MSNFKVGKSRFSRFINGKGFYIALALCLVAIGAAAYIAANNSFGSVSDLTSSNSGSSSNTDYTNWDDTSAQQTNNPVSGVAGSSSSSASSEVSSAASSSATGSSSSQSSSLAAPTVFIMPVSGDIITAYSNDKLVYDKTMNDYRVHDAINIAASVGTPVKACADGVVLDVKTDDMLGEVVTIQHGGGLVSTYANLTTGVSVKKGQKVEAGDVIGAVGQTAKCEISLVSHLHFAMTKNGTPVDPLATMGKE